MLQSTLDTPGSRFPIEIIAGKQEKHSHIYACIFCISPYSQLFGSSGLKLDCHMSRHLGTRYSSFLLSPSIIQEYSRGYSTPDTRL